VPAPGRSRLRLKRWLRVRNPGEGSWATPPFYIERLKAFIPDGQSHGRILRSESGHHVIASGELRAGAVKARRPRCVVRAGGAQRRALAAPSTAPKSNAWWPRSWTPRRRYSSRTQRFTTKTQTRGRSGPPGRVREQGHRAKWVSLTPLPIDLFCRCARTAAKNAARYVVRAEGRNARLHSKLATRAFLVNRMGCVRNLRR